ncbi:hypothetical protein N8475_10320 [Winogradskyella sp.]|nr:hypothetical protein [Winogradskyella sp.]
MTNIQYTGDFDSWLKLSQKHSVVIFQPGLIWWRQHDGQEYKAGQNPSKYLKSTTEINFRYITDPKSPFSDIDRIEAIEIMKQRHARMYLFHIFKLRFSYALKYFKYSSISWKDIPKGLKKSKVNYYFED